MNSGRMVIQTLLIIFESFLLYITLIGISGIQFKDTTFNKVILLTAFNDKQHELESQLMKLAKNMQEI